MKEKYFPDEGLSLLPFSLVANNKTLEVEHQKDMHTEEVRTSYIKVLMGYGLTEAKAIDVVHEYMNFINNMYSIFRRRY